MDSDIDTAPLPRPFSADEPTDSDIDTAPLEAAFSADEPTDSDIDPASLEADPSRAHSADEPTGSDIDTTPLDLAAAVVLAEEPQGSEPPDVAIALDAAEVLPVPAAVLVDAAVVDVGAVVAGAVGGDSSWCSSPPIRSGSPSSASRSAEAAASSASRRTSPWQASAGPQWHTKTFPSRSMTLFSTGASRRYLRNLSITSSRVPSGPILKGFAHAEISTPLPPQPSINTDVF